MPFSWRFRRRMRLVGLGLCGLGLMCVGFLAALEGAYQVSLRRLPSLPTPPAATDRLPANVARVYWSLFEPGGAMEVEPIRPWNAVWVVTRNLVSRPSPMDVPPGWTLADTVARHWSPDGSRRMPLGHGLRHMRMAGALTPEEAAEARATPVVLSVAPLAQHPCPSP